MVDGPTSEDGYTMSSPCESEYSDELKRIPFLSEIFDKLEIFYNTSCSPT